ncbi:MAG: GntR family transcriptional regulator [Armatimonadetes bacterium]|nr:GntR family transcriptional regulator [Armatimonadota bacterium]
MQKRPWKSIAEELEAQIASGKLAPGSRMPSGDALADSLGVNRNSVHRALEELQRRGLVVRRQGSGTVVAEAKGKQVSRVALLVDGYSAIHNFPSGDLLRGIQDRLGEEINLIIADSRHDPTLEAQQLARLSMEADGILLYPSSPKETLGIATLLKKKVPVVALDRLPTGVEMDAVTTENYGAIHKVVAGLIEQGHVHIGFLATYKPSFSSVQERVRGYQDAMAEAGLDAEEFFRWIPEDERPDSKVTFQIVRDSIVSLRSGSRPITALVCLEDSLGCAAVLACSRLGIVLPTELEITTFNDWHPNSLLQPWNVRRITQQKYEIGRAAADLLLKRLHNPSRPYEVVRVEAELVPFDADFREIASPSISELIVANEGQNL